MLKTTPTIETLERQAERLYVVMAAAEPWAKQYEDDPDTHVAIIKHEAKMARVFRDYFRGFMNRLDNYVRWSTYQQQALKAYDVNVTVNADNFDAEDGILITTVTDVAAEGIAIGALAGENMYETPLGLDKYSQIVIDTANKYTSRLVTQINSTTLDYLQKSLATSIKLGETTDQARARIAKRIADPGRAAMIARTESVNAYQTGMITFGNQSGAVGKEWQAIIGACQICAPLDGVRVKIDEPYNNDVGPNPPGHPNCRCGQRLIYQNELDENPNLFNEQDTVTADLTTHPDGTGGKLTVRADGNVHNFDLNPIEHKFVQDTKLQVLVDQHSIALQKGVLGMYRPRTHSIYVKPPTGKNMKNYEATFRHELGHSIDHQLVKGKVLSDDVAAAAITADKTAVVKARLGRYSGKELKPEWIDQFAAGTRTVHYTDGKGAARQISMPQKYITYLRSRSEVFGDGYSQYRADPAGFQTRAPKLFKVYKELGL
jgi:hypothetical protein